jgi:hypothetical protein
MNFSILKANRILIITLLLSISLVITIFFKYRPSSWPLGKEAEACLLSLILLTATTLLLWILKDKISNDDQKRNVALGLCYGLLWTFEIGINNLVRPGLPLRDIIDNIFWAIIALLILITAFGDSYRKNDILSGIKSGFWTGLSSGAVACFSALFLIVFGMKFILLDPLNIREWNDLKAIENSQGMDVYFAYQSFAGALMHLIILGAIMGLFLGFAGGISGKTLRILKKS